MHRLTTKRECLATIHPLQHTWTLTHEPLSLHSQAAREKAELMLEMTSRSDEAQLRNEELEVKLATISFCLLSTSAECSPGASPSL